MSTARVFTRTSTPIFSSCLRCSAAASWSNGGSTAAGALEQDDPRLVGVDRAVVVRQHLVRELGELADELDAGRPGADHDERQPLGAFLRIGAISAISNLDRIASRR